MILNNTYETKFMNIHPKKIDILALEGVPACSIRMGKQKGQRLAFIASPTII